MSTTAERDPIKLSPLRNPGQSLEEQQRTLLDDTVVPWVIMAFISVLFAAWECARWAFEIRLNPFVPVIFSVGMIGFAAVRIRRVQRQLRNYRTGLRGERMVGMFLQNSLLKKGYWIIHDVPCDGFNIDHVAIGPGGVFAIETKTWSKPSGKATIHFDGDTVLFDGRQPDRNPVAQARGCAQQLRRILLEFSGQDHPVKSVVLFPGWYIEGSSRNQETWVLNEKAFVAFVDNESERLSREQAFVLAAALGRYVRERGDGIG